MKASVCITVFNEEGSIDKLLKSLVKQTKRPNEIVVVDGGSTDGTVQKIKRWRRKYKFIRLYERKHCSRSKARNIAVQKAKFNIIAMTDAGCVADKRWLERMIEPFVKGKPDIVAGFYNMTGANPIQKAFSVFLGVQPTDFSEDFLPSTRSITFTKSAWRKIGMFPEDLKDTAEDTVFNYRALKEGLSIKRVINARVGWEMPSSLREGISKMYFYAKGDVRSKIWLHPSKGMMSHNVKIVLIFTRYFCGLILLIICINNPILLIVLIALLIFYLFWAFEKVYRCSMSLKAGLWGIVLQIASDFAVMSGFVSGLLNN